jgi:BRCT domain type II-containing protein
LKEKDIKTLLEKKLKEAKELKRKLMEEQEFQQFINDVNQESENSIDINKNQIEKLKHKIRI